MSNVNADQIVVIDDNDDNNSNNGEERPVKRQRQESTSKTIDLDCLEDISDESSDEDELDNKMTTSNDIDPTNNSTTTTTITTHTNEKLEAHEEKAQNFMIPHLDLLIQYSHQHAEIFPKIRSHLHMISSTEQLRQHILQVLKIPSQYHHTVKIEYLDPLFKEYIRFTNAEFLVNETSARFIVTSGDPSPDMSWTLTTI